MTWGSEMYYVSEVKKLKKKGPRRKGRLWEWYKQDHYQLIR